MHYFLYTHIQLRAMSTFLLPWICFLSLFCNREDCIVRAGTCILTIQIISDTITSVNSSQTQDFFCFISVVLAEHLFENLHVFFPLKCSIFQILRLQRKKMYLLCKHLLLLHGEISFYWSSNNELLSQLTKFTLEN